MTKEIWKPGTLLAPVPPVLVSCGTMENPNIITIGWTGIINSRPPMTYISVRPERHSYDIIKNSGEFVINLPTAKLAFAVDYCGVRSGKNMDKFKEMKLTAQRAKEVSAPMIAESPLSIECKVKDCIHLGSHDMFLAEIVAVQVDDSAFNKEGKLDFIKCGLIAYAHGEYFTLGKRLGHFGFSVKKKTTKRKKRESGKTK